MKTLTMRNLLASLFIIITLVSCENTSGISNTSTISSSATSICTSAVLNLPSIPADAQKKNKWCWAASMAMIMKYHIPSSKQQFELVQDYYNVYSMGSTIKNDCYIRQCDANPNDVAINCVKSISIFQPNFNLGFGGSYNQYFNLLFLFNDWISVEDTQISWDRLKFEINSCRPVILVRDTAVSGSVFHAVVAKGFIECSDGTKKVIVNDPFEVCVGHEDYLNFPFEILVNNKAKKTVLEAIYYINPKSKNECTLCNDINKTNPVPESVLVSLKTGINRFTTNKNLSFTDYITSINKDSQNYIIPVKRVSFNNVSKYYKYPNIDSNSFDGNIRFNKIYENIESVDIIPKSVDNQLLYRMTKGVSGYQNEKVSPFIPYDFNKIKSMANSVNASNYYLVESYFLGFDFFVFETPNGNFVSKATRGKQYSLTNPIEESIFWKENEKNIFLPIF